MYADGKLLSAKEGIIRLNPGTWVNLNNRFGYVPLGGTKFYQEREINNDAAFFKIVIDHGERPKENAAAHYAYAILPEVGIEETIEFSQEPSVEILAQSEAMHAVLDKETNIVGINVFESGESLMGVKFLTPCSVIIDSDKFYITDPTQTLSEIKLEFLKDISVASEHDVTVSGRVVTIKMPIKGKSYSFTVSEI